MSFQRRKEVKCRKAHKCDSCGRTINIGQTAVYSAGKYRDTFSTGYSCLTCEEIWDEIDSVMSGFEREEEFFCNDMLDTAQDYDIIRRDDDGKWRWVENYDGLKEKWEAGELVFEEETA